MWFDSDFFKNIYCLGEFSKVSTFATDGFWSLAISRSVDLSTPPTWRDFVFSRGGGQH